MASLTQAVCQGDTTGTGSHHDVIICIPRRNTGACGLCRDRLEPWKEVSTVALLLIGPLPLAHLHERVLPTATSLVITFILAQLWQTRGQKSVPLDRVRG